MIVAYSPSAMTKVSVLVAVLGSFRHLLSARSRDGPLANTKLGRVLTSMAAVSAAPSRGGRWIYKCSRLTLGSPTGKPEQSPHHHQLSRVHLAFPAFLPQATAAPTPHTSFQIHSSAKQSSISHVINSPPLRNYVGSSYRAGNIWGA